ncbi:MAG: hypothetical protein WA724_09680 [Candidatus Dormiibacterota bacterium]
MTTNINMGAASDHLERRSVVARVGYIAPWQHGHAGHTLDIDAERVACQTCDDEVLMERPAGAPVHSVASETATST